MELLFYYNANQAYLNPKGVQFGGKYVFDFETDSNKIYFKENENYKSNFYSDESTLQNITAIVGENGSGKTTLLHAIFENSGPGVLMIFLEKENSIILSNDYGDISIEYIGKEKTPNIASDDKYLQRIEPNKQHICSNIHKHVSYVYLSNSIFLKNMFGYNKDVSISNVMLTPISINEIAEEFYRNIKSIQSNEKEFHDADYINILQYEELKGFQSLCTIEYYYFLLTNNLEHNYLGKELQNIQVRAISPKINTQVLIDSDEEERFFKVWDSYSEICSAMNKGKINIINVLLCDLMLEICNVLEIACNKEIDISNTECLTNECNILLNVLEEKVNPQLENVKKYYQFALKSINELYNILGDVLEKTNISGIIVSWENKNKYKAFVGLIHECLFKDLYLGTFLVTHLSFEQTNLSSGEQAMQNFFSWIHALDWFHRIDSYTIDGMKDSIILLIDEIDLYAHPEWQRQIVCRLLEDIDHQFRHKKVQIIFSTHSPLVLSDMLLNNIIFLQQGKCITPAGMEETFSNELYSILNNSFFLRNGVIGEFARKKIQKIIDKLVDSDKSILLEDRELRAIEEEIKVVGDPIVKMKLYEMLDEYKSKYEKREMDIDSEINILKMRIQYLERQKEE